MENYEILGVLQDVNSFECHCAFTQGGEITQPNEFEVKAVHAEGGSSGEGEYVCVVIEIVGQNKFFRNEAFYSSYGGIDFWEGWEEVFPREQLVTFYESKDEQE